MLLKYSDAKVGVDSKGNVAVVIWEGGTKRLSKERDFTDANEEEFNQIIKDLKLKKQQSETSQSVRNIRTELKGRV
jgi:hypothetical protein